VLSTRTHVDSPRFRVHIADQFGVSPVSVDAMVFSEHGASEVYLWSFARVGRRPVLDALAQQDLPIEGFRRSIEREVRFANIAINEGNDASRYGIGMVAARIAEIVLRDEQAVIPIGCYNRSYGLTLSLPTIVGRSGITPILQPSMSAEEHPALQRSADTLKSALEHVGSALGRPTEASVEGTAALPLHLVVRFRKQRAPRRGLQ
jgi:L-lactate dehydrogenase